MARSLASLNTIEDFLAQKRIAFVGMSRDPRHISFALFKEFTRKGHEIYFVNPAATELFGYRSYARVQDIVHPPDAALLLTPPAITEQVVRDCADIGIKRVWMYRGGGKGAVSAEAIRFCESKGIKVVAGECPFMFLNPVRHVHRFHRFLVKITGNYPQRQEIGRA